MSRFYTCLRLENPYLATFYKPLNKGLSFFEWTGPTDNIPFLLCATLSYHGSASKGKNKGGGGKNKKEEEEERKGRRRERGWVGDMKERRKEEAEERREGKGERVEGKEK